MTDEELISKLRESASCREYNGYKIQELAYAAAARLTALTSPAPPVDGMQVRIAVAAISPSKLRAFAINDDRFGTGGYVVELAKRQVRTDLHQEPICWGVVTATLPLPVVESVRGEVTDGGRESA